MLRWRAQRFRRFYELHQKRLILNGLEKQKSDMVAALWSNSAWDESEDKEARKRAIGDINQNYFDAVEAVEDAIANKDRVEEEKVTEDNPFFAAAERGLSKVEQKMKGKQVEEGEPVDYMKGLDQE